MADADTAAFQRFHAALFANQPDEGAESYPSDDELVAQAEKAGAPDSVADCITSGKYRDMVNHAVKSAGIDIQQVGYVNTHGTSTSRGDIAECTALEKAFGGKIDNVKINSTKSMTGHMLGAASAVEAIVTIKSPAGAETPSDDQR